MKFTNLQGAGVRANAQHPGTHQVTKDEEAREVLAEFDAATHDRTLFTESAVIAAMLSFAQQGVSSDGAGLRIVAEREAYCQRMMDLPGSLNTRFWEQRRNEARVIAMHIRDAARENHDSDEEAALAAPGADIPDDDEANLALSVLDDTARADGWRDARARFDTNDINLITHAMVQYGDERAAPTTIAGQSDKAEMERLREALEDAHGRAACFSNICSGCRSNVRHIITALATSPRDGEG